jgi:hypothetical protein
VKQAEPLRAGTIMKATRWQPYAVFDTDSGALVQTLLVPQFEEGPVCYSDSGMTFISNLKRTLDSIVPKTSNKQ